MKTFELSDSPARRNLWRGYANSGYTPQGFRGYVQRKIPSAYVTGTTAKGLTLTFENDVDYTFFVLEYM